MGRFGIVKISSLHKLIYNYIAFPIKITKYYFRNSYKDARKINLR